MSASTASERPMLRVSVREARLTLDRIFLAAGVHDGLVPAVRDHAHASACVDLGGWPMVRDRHAVIGAAEAARITALVQYMLHRGDDGRDLSRH